MPAVTIIVDPLPRTLDMICDAPTRARLEALGPLVVHEDGPMPDALVEEHLPEDLARGIGAADRAMRAGTERHGLESNADAFLLAGSPVGIVGFGDLGRELRRLIAPFGCPVRVYDPWLPDELVRRHDAEPVPVEHVLAQRVIFVFASVTAENEGFLGRAELERIRPGSVFVLMSRAGVVDFDALVELVATGRFRAATDVFPEEPVAADHPVRKLEGMLLAPHRAGGIREAFLEIGRLAVADLELILRGLPPRCCKRAERETAGRMRSRPVERS